VIVPLIKRLIREFQQRLEELKDEQRDRDEGDALVVGARRTAPVYVRDDGELLPEQAHLDAIDLDFRLPVASVTAPPERPAIRTRLRSRAQLRDAVVMREILDRPLTLRRPSRRSFRDR
jgi:hypothetical protein